MSSFFQLFQFGHRCAEKWQINDTQSKVLLSRLEEEIGPKLEFIKALRHADPYLRTDTINDTFPSYAFCHTMNPWRSCKVATGTLSDSSDWPDVDELFVSHFNLLVQQLDANGPGSRHGGFHRPLKAMLYVHFTKGSIAAIEYWLSLIRYGALFDASTSSRILHHYVEVADAEDAQFARLAENFSMSSHDTLLQSNVHDYSDPDFQITGHSRTIRRVISTAHKYIRQANTSRNLSELVDFQAFVGVVGNIIRASRLKPESKGIPLTADM